MPFSQRDWAAGFVVAIAWDQVAHCLVFDNIEEYERAVSAAPMATDLEKSN